MAFTNFLYSLRRAGRGMVLPVDKIKTVCRNALENESVETVLDFGAGTLFWTDWFIKEFKSKVYAVDIYYDRITTPKNDRIIRYANFNKCIEENTRFSLVWACDVLHHLTQAQAAGFLEKVTDKTDVIIIKDIDANYAFGNFMNRLHDKIINRTAVYDIFPAELKQYFEQQGFRVSYYFIPKIWYPHFIIVGIRGGG